MQTQCPNCRTVYRVSEEFVDALDARVRCSQCLIVFNARDNLIVSTEDDLDGQSEKNRDQGVFVAEDDDPFDDTVAIDSLMEIVEPGDAAQKNTPDQSVRDEARSDADIFAELLASADQSAQEQPTPLHLVSSRDRPPGQGEDPLDWTTDLSLPSLELPDFDGDLDKQRLTASAGEASYAGAGQSLAANDADASVDQIRGRNDASSEPAESLTETLIETSTGDAPDKDVDEASPADERFGETDTDPEQPESATAPKPSSLDNAPQPPDSDADTSPRSFDGPIPDLMREEIAASERPPVSRRRQWPWAVGALVLLLGISVQLLYWQRDALASQPATRPLAEQLCRLFACQLPAMRDVSAIRLLQRSVYSHPNVSNALIIRLSMSNEASFAQPYPTLAIRMTDRQGRTVAARDFKPTVYLGDGALQQTMPPGQPVTVTLEVLDPGRDARSYELDFL